MQGIFFYLSTSLSLLSLIYLSNNSYQGPRISILCQYTYETSYQQKQGQFLHPASLFFFSSFLLYLSLFSLSSSLTTKLLFLQGPAKTAIRPISPSCSLYWTWIALLMRPRISGRYLLSSLFSPSHPLTLSSVSIIRLIRCRVSASAIAMLE